MSRTRLAMALLLGAAAVTVVVVLATSTPGKGGSSASAAPACLPTTLNHSAKLPGLAVDVSPAPETGTANPHTQISFLGVVAADIHDVSVVGEHSGRHPGRLAAYSQGDGASFVPDRPFQAGERVSVHATIDSGAGSGRSGSDGNGSGGNGSGGSGSDGSGSGSSGSGGSFKPVAFGFRIDTPYSTAKVPPFPNPPAPAGDYQSFVTMPGVQAPVLNVTVPDRDPKAGDILTTNGPSAGRYGPLIYTPQGRLVWFDQLAGDTSAENLSVQAYEGRRDLTLWQGKVLSLGFGQGEDIVLNDRYRTVARVGGGNGLQADLHDFQIVPRGVAYTTAYNAIRCDLSSAGGEGGGTILDTAVQEIDMKSGLVRWEWHSLDHVGVAESQTSPPKKTPWDWFHLNSVDAEPDGNLFISARSTWAGYQLQAGSGRVLWRLGGLKSSFRMGPGTKTAWQHDGRVLPGGDVTFFDNGSNPPVHHESRAVRIALDARTHKAHLRSVLTHPNPLLSVSQGNMQTLPSGNTVVGYGAIPEVSEYAKDGSLLFDAHLSFVMSSYRSVRFPWRGRPLTPPAVVASLNSTREGTIVRVSWNGATDVAAWRLLAGGGRESLRARATIPASNFESSTVLPERYGYVEAQALDRAGRVLGSSATSRVQ